MFKILVWRNKTLIQIVEWIPNQTFCRETKSTTKIDLNWEIVNWVKYNYYKINPNKTLNQHLNKVKMLLLHKQLSYFTI